MASISKSKLHRHQQNNVLQTRSRSGLLRVWLPILLFPLILGLSAVNALAKSPAGSPGTSPSPPTSPPEMSPAISPGGSPAVSPKPTRGTSPAPLPVGGVKPNGLNCPSSHPIKGNVGSHGKIYHAPGSASYQQTKPEVCFSTTATAQTAGFKPPKK